MRLPNNTRVYQAFWTKPARLRRWGVGQPVWKSYVFYTLSGMLVKRHYPEAELVMHTDEESRGVFAEIGVWDTVENTLEPLRKEPAFFFAQGKIRAVEREAADALYMDGDVFLRSDFLHTAMEETYDVLVQSEDAFDRVGMSGEELSVYITDDTNPAIGERMLNTGLLHFKDNALRTAWVEWYKANTARLARQPELRNIWMGTRLNFELSTEQVALWNLARGKHVKTLYEDGYRPEDKDKNYLHMLGKLKYHDFYINRMMREIDEMDSDIRRKLEDLQKRV